MIDKFKTKITQLRNEINFHLHSKTVDIPNITIGKIPSGLNEFMNSDDKWVEIPTLSDNKDCTSAFYIGSAGSVFPEHKHTSSSEQMVIVNEGGKMRVVTTHIDRIVEYPDAIVIPKDVPHIVYFLKETELIILWHPPLNGGWTAEKTKTLKRTQQ